MAKSLSSLFLTLLIGYALNAQISEAFPPEMPVSGASKVKVTPTQGQEKTTDCGIDTLYYARHNNSYIIPRYLTIPSNAGAGLYFAIDDTVWLYGFNFHSYALGAGFVTQNVTCKVYYASANKTPAGLALASKTYTIQAFGSTVKQTKQKFLFNNPIMLVSNFVITVEVPNTSNQVVFLSNDYRNNDGLGKHFSCVKLSNGWSNNLVINSPTDTVPFDADFYLEPVVSYKMSAQYSHGENSCLGNGKPFQFVNSTTFALNPQFSKEMLDTTLDDNFIWDYGDGSPTDTVLHGNHFYSGTLGYYVNLQATFKNWRGNVCKDDSSIFLEEGDVQANFQNTANNLLVSFTNKSVKSDSWEWDFGDGSPKSTQKNPTHQYPTYGLYPVELKARNKGCVDSVILVLNLKNTGIGDVKDASFNADISPNPVADVLKISSNLKDNESGRWAIYSIQGKQVEQGTFRNGSELVLEHLEKGVYFIQLSSEGALITRRFIKQ